MTPRFERPETGEGVAVVDPIERHRYTLGTPAAVTPEPAATENFRFPVDTAVSFRTTALSLPSVISVHVRDETGAALCKAEHFAYEKLPRGSYTIELSAPVKLYVRVHSTVTVSADAERMSIDFDDETEVVLGARSHHERPAATVTTTADPRDVMHAVSTFGSALKTTSPERSYPTLRGHPPTVELGDELDLAGLEPPDTGVTVEIPPDLRSVFVVAPLAYYLGARVEPGDSPLLETDRGFEYSLEGPEGFERTVERTLKQVFFLDCLTRTEGLYPVDLHERRALEADLGLDFVALYNRSLAEQLEAYLDVPFEAVEGHLPEWKLTTHIEPVPGSVEMLPFVVDDLAVVRCASTEMATSPATTAIASDGGMAATAEEARGEGDFTRSGSASAPVELDEFVQPETTDSLEAAWVGEGTPLGTSKATTEAYLNSLERTPTDGDIDITVVCNDAQMDEERGLIDEIYGDRAELPFDIVVEKDLTTAELHALFAEPTDFLHYVGHVDAEGFLCADGKLDARDLDSVGVDAFLLNAYQSYQQGMALIERGAIGGIVTLSDVLNCEAVKIGRTLAGLLNCGFPLRAALEIARDESIMGGEYIVVGDGGLAVAQSASVNPNLLHIERAGESFDLEIEYYPTKQLGMGSIIIPYINGSEHHLSTGDVRLSNVARDDLDRFLSLENVPVKSQGKLRWSQGIDSNNL